MVPIVNQLFPYNDLSSGMIESWDEKATDAPPISYRAIMINDSIAKFYGLKIKEGAQTFNVKQQEVFINETFAQKMGVINPLEKQMGHFVVKGIVYDFQSQSPTSSVPPMLIFPLPYSSAGVFSVAFKYEGEFSIVEKMFRETFEREGGASIANEQLRMIFEAMKSKYILKDSEAEYRKMLEPEYNILKLLSIVFVVSLFMALFGIYALVVQACEKHRKEIAIRKVNGARVIDILSLFFSQYMQQVVVAAIIAFPIGFWVIKRWLEQYALQTEINFWVFLAVFFTTALLVTACVAWHVWRAANENPAHVIRKE